MKPSPVNGSEISITHAARIYFLWKEYQNNAALYWLKKFVVVNFVNRLFKTKSNKILFYFLPYHLLRYLVEVS